MIDLVKHVKWWIRLFFDLSLPAYPPTPPLQPELEGPAWFIWYEQFGMAKPMILYQCDGGPPSGHLACHELKPSEYRDSIPTLARRYPPPEMPEKST